MNYATFYVDNTEGRYKQLTLELYDVDGQKVSAWTLEPPRYPRTCTAWIWARQARRPVAIG
jgi:hypothetical protein